MLTKLYWVDGPWPGKLALAARPRTYRVGGSLPPADKGTWPGIGRQTPLCRPWRIHSRDVRAAPLDWPLCRQVRGRAM